MSLILKKPRVEVKINTLENEGSVFFSLVGQIWPILL